MFQKCSVKRIVDSSNICKKMASVTLLRYILTSRHKHICIYVFVCTCAAIHDGFIHVHILCYHTSSKFFALPYYTCTELFVISCENEITVMCIVKIHNCMVGSKLNFYIFFLHFVWMTYSLSLYNKPNLYILNRRAVSYCKWINLVLLACCKGCQNGKNWSASCFCTFQTFIAVIQNGGILEFVILVFIFSISSEDKKWQLYYKWAPQIEPWK